MPIFELDEGRPRLVQPMQPLAGSFASDCAALLTDHLAAVAGEPLFVVRARAATSEHADVPEVLALDATGRAVVVEVAQVVDEDAVVAALRHAGSAARMTTTDLARAYHPDPSRFPVDFAAFREQAAFGVTTNRREGVRLILLCSEVATAAGDTLGFLRGPGRSVEVLQLGVVRGADDRRLLDVSPLATHETVRRSVEPTALRLVRSSEAFATAMAYDPGRVTTGSRPPAEAAPAAPAPAASAATRAADPPVRVSVASRAVSASASSAVTPVTGVPLGFDGPPSPSPTSGPAHGPTSGPAHVAAEVAVAWTPDAAAPEATAPEVPEPAPAEAPAAVAPTPAAAPPPAVGPRTPVPAVLATPVAESLAWQPAGGIVPASLPSPPVTSWSGSASAQTPGAPQRSAPAAPAVPAPASAAAPTSPPPPPPPVASSWSAPVPLGYDGPVARPELGVLANQRRAATTMVWLRERRNQRLVATLRRDGLLELPDGRVFADPDDAASAAAGALVRVDGWRSWRLGDGGPTLAEAVAATAH